MRQNVIAVAILLAGIWVGVLCSRAIAEPAAWTDSKLPVRDGLVGWYDGVAEDVARKAGNLAPIKSGEPVDRWHDGSGHGRHLVQAQPDRRPVFRADENLRFIRFDGQSQYLAAEQLGLALDEVTIFLVAAPFSNDGYFRGMLATSSADGNDYVTGLNIDQGPDTSRKFATINVEGAGFGGARNLKPGPTPFGELTRICLTSSVGPNGTAFLLDGKPAGKRDRSEGKIQLDRLTAGARFYTNGGPAETRGFFCGEIAEIVIYDRRLTDDEIARVDDYLQQKYGERRSVPIPPELAEARPIARTEEPPPVEMLAPGFAVRELPIDLPNVNNVLYRADGTLVVVTYDGHIHLLKDTDGDGLEDRATAFWDQPGLTSPIGMALTPPGYESGQGVFVPGQGKLSLVVDTDGDDRADELIVVANQWTPLKHSVDAMGVAVAQDGSVYFGLGTQDFTNAYLIDDKQQAHYDVAGNRGTIMKVSPDFGAPERVCSGIRFPVALRFNRHGDLFCTDQEGATWLSNGNPFDELLHIQPQRHYGFPPRHPKHLNAVLDEPSTYDYSPQHQSTCGLNFNESAEGGQLFGPEWWFGDAIVCGYSRGKLYRTTLVKTEAGYVAAGALLACLQQLTVDACLSPRGDLVVATHSGGPDWGSGPGGRGKLYQIRYEDRDCPQPVAAWAAGSHEVRVAFDRPLDARQFERFTRDVKIEYGPHVRAGDRFETFWPGYSVVEMQARGYRRMLPVLATSLTTDGRAMVLTTGEHPDAVSYAVLLSDDVAKPSGGVLARVPAVELAYDLSGVEAEWRGSSAGQWSGRVPHLDLEAAEGLLAGSAEADVLRSKFAEPGTLVLRTQLDLWQMLRSATQPGSKLDFTLPAEDVTVVLESNAGFKLRTPDGEIASTVGADGKQRLEWMVRAAGEAWYPVEVELPTGSRQPKLKASWRTAEDPRERPFPVRRFLLPWARKAAQTPGDDKPAIHPELAGGDWHRGREVFFGEQAQCGKCHAVRGRGGWIGPDLSNLVHRDYASVLRDITSPSFAINPEHLAYQVVLDDGRVLTGMVRSQGDQLTIGDIHGKETEISRARVEEMRPALISIMPEGLPKLIGPDRMRDLLAFLLLAEPGGLEPAPIEQPGAPAPRTRAEVGEVLKSAQPVDRAPLKPLDIVLVAGPKDHGPGEHDYPAWQKRWTQLLGGAEKVTVQTADPWPSAEQWEKADVVVMFSANPAWTQEQAGTLDRYFARGGGLVLLHYAVNGQRAPEEFARRVGLAWNPQGSRFRHGELELNFRTGEPHPITAGFSKVQFVDESYWNLIGDEKQVRVLATQVEDGAPRPMLWAYEPGKGRVFCSILGHYSWTFDDPLFRLLVLRGMAWTARQPVDRFNDLLLSGARVAGATPAASPSSPSP